MRYISNSSEFFDWISAAYIVFLWHGWICNLSQGADFFKRDVTGKIFKKFMSGIKELPIPAL